MDWHDILVEPGTWGLCAAGDDGEFLLMTSADGLDLEDRDGPQKVCVGHYIDEDDYKFGGGCIGGKFFGSIQQAIDFYNGGE